MRETSRALLILCTAAACDAFAPGPEQVAPNDVALDRTFTASLCKPPSNPPAPPPCFVTIAPSGRTYVDSGRVRLGPSHLAEWMLGTHAYSCPCYLGGCSTPCSDTPGVVENGTGSYQISGNDVVVQTSSRTITLNAVLMPTAVSKTWTGPDSLTLTIQGPGNSGTVVFRPQ